MIEVEGLTKYYGEARAISDLSFRIEKGQIVGFLGLNGAGKSTALKILAGFLLPTSGSVRFDGIDVVAEPDRLRERIGFLPERPPLYDEMTVEDFLRYLGRLRGMSRSRLEQRLPAVLERTDLTARRDQLVGTLSLGFRKRVGIAQSIVHDPELVILDEPIGGLDPRQIRQMRELVRGLRGDHTVLISSHILPEVEETCDHLLVLRDGELVATGTEQELLASVRPDDGLEVGLRGDLDAAIRLLRSLDAVTEVVELERSGEGGTLRVVSPGDGPEAVAAALVGAGFGLRRLASAENQLEAAFLAVIGSGGGA